VLHDTFGLSFDDIAPILNRSPIAAHQLASRARRRIQGAATEVDSDRERQREVVSAFLAAARDGDFAGLLAVLDPDAVLHADSAAVEASIARAGVPALTSEILGSAAVAYTFRGRAQAARPALIDGEPGLVFAPAGKVQVVFDFVTDHGRVVEISLIADPAHIATLRVEV